jgi:hypothetical protein
MAAIKHKAHVVDVLGVEVGQVYIRQCFAVCEHATEVFSFGSVEECQVEVL